MSELATKQSIANKACRLATLGLVCFAILTLLSFSGDQGDLSSYLAATEIHAKDSKISDIGNDIIKVKWNDRLYNSGVAAAVDIRSHKAGGDFRALSVLKPANGDRASDTVSLEVQDTTPKNTNVSVASDSSSHILDGDLRELSGPKPVKGNEASDTVSSQLQITAPKKADFAAASHAASHIANEGISEQEVPKPANGDGADTMSRELEDTVSKSVDVVAANIAGSHQADGGFSELSVPKPVNGNGASDTVSHKFPDPESKTVDKIIPALDKSLKSEDGDTNGPSHSLFHGSNQGLEVNDSSKEKAPTLVRTCLNLTKHWTILELKKLYKIERKILQIRLA